jgi:hypothetical protein
MAIPESARPGRRWRPWAAAVLASLLAASLGANAVAWSYRSAVRAGASDVIENALGDMVFAGANLRHDPGSAEQKRIASNVTARFPHVGRRRQGNK